MATEANINFSFHSSPMSWHFNFSQSSPTCSPPGIPNFPSLVKYGRSSLHFGIFSVGFLFLASHHMKTHNFNCKKGLMNMGALDIHICTNPKHDGPCDGDGSKRIGIIAKNENSRAYCSSTPVARKIHQ